MFKKSDNPRGVRVDSLQSAWNSLFLVAFLATYVFILLEWLFLITKPSFLNAIGFIKKVEILFFLGSVTSGVVVTLLFPLLLGKLIPNICAKERQLLKAGGFIPALVIACTGLMVVDNFTYTIFHTGIISSGGVARGLYGLAFIAAVVFAYKKIVIPLLEYLEKSFNKRDSGIMAFKIIVAIVIFSVGSIFLGKPASSTLQKEFIPLGQMSRPVNVLYITADGLNANHMSVYGYERDTTPRLRQLADESLVANHHFSNSTNTYSSILSSYTGKLPPIIGIQNPPNILKGAASFQHLPGILNYHGYYTAQVGTPMHVDAVTSNLLEGFDRSNGRELSTEVEVIKDLNSRVDSEIDYFFSYTKDRLLSRLKHIFFFEPMFDPIDFIFAPEEYTAYDQDKVDELMRSIDHSEKPFFIHLHLLGTHGPRFFVEEQVFSAGRNMDEVREWDPYFYDDSILEFDHHVGKIVDHLAARHLLDHTILIISSDHGSQWSSTTRIPLLIRFPNGEYAGTITRNTQNIDIAPTILSYIGVAKPVWMQGQTLTGEIFERVILSTGSDEYAVTDGLIDVEKLEPPFFQFGVIRAIHCGTWYSLNLKNNNWSSGTVEGYSGTCDQEIAENQVYMDMVRLLYDSGFRIESLRWNPSQTAG